ncbi:response regulator transcription factor [Actinosynnema sp. NPDC050436]|uniref:response regulator transcription factor n=1 Tax=Actinosynnema sp. NPDC050436 TaxID=3155659 RepID=UPI0033D2C4CD
MTTVQIIDRSPVYLSGLSAILRDHGFLVVLPKCSAESADSVDLLVVEAELMACDLPELAAAATRPPLLLLTQCPIDDLVPNLTGSGVAGFVDRRENADTIVSAVRATASGGFFPSDSGSLGHDLGSNTETEALSQRERQVLDHIARGFTHFQVANRLGISRHTVDTYVKRIRTKLCLGNKAQLARAALLGRNLRGTGLA